MLYTFCLHEMKITCQWTQWKTIFDNYLFSEAYFICIMQGQKDNKPLKKNPLSILITLIDY